MSSILSRCVTRQLEEAVVVVKAAEEKAVEDAERGTSVLQHKMTQTSKKVTKGSQNGSSFGRGSHKDNQDS